MKPCCALYKTLCEVPSNDYRSSGNCITAFVKPCVVNLFIARQTMLLLPFRFPIHIHNTHNNDNGQNNKALFAFTLILPHYPN